MCASGFGPLAVVGSRRLGPAGVRERVRAARRRGLAQTNGVCGCRVSEGREHHHGCVRFALVLVVAAVVAASCGGSTRVSTGIPGEGAAGVRATTTLPEPSTSPSSGEAPAERATTTIASVAPTEGAPTTPPAATAPTEGAPTTPPAVIAPTTVLATSDPPSGSASSTAPATTSPVQEEGDEPTFEAEPLEPFVVDPSASGEPLTGWAAFDQNLRGSLLRNGNVSASAAVMIDGDIVHTVAFGNRTYGRLDPVEDIDRYRIASISKTFTAITMLQLVEDGIVGLDEPVGARVAEHVGITAPSPAVASITPRQLLNHTAGFGKYQSVFFGKGADDCRHAAAIGLSGPVRSPGASYVYSNMSYCVAGMAIEALTGEEYERVVYREVLTPLGISGPRLAATFDPGPDEALHPTTLGRNYMETLHAAGAWIATPSDLVTVLDSLDHSTPGFKPLEPLTMLAMTTPVFGQRGQRGYGLGLLLYGPGRYGHTGTIEGTHAMVQNRGDGVTWAITVSGPYPDDTPRLESIINDAFVAGGFIAG